MKTKRQSQRERSGRELGAALLIAIFALLLISVVAIALIVTSGTDTALARNYRTSTNAYYAALAGVEEARGRLLPFNPNVITLPGNPMPLTNVVYIINPAGGETVAPDNTGDPTTYPDTEYKQEFGVDVSSRVVTKIPSIWPIAGNQGPSYKWVRINPVTEQSLGNSGSGIDVNGDNTIDAFTPLFYDPANKDGFGNIAAGLIEKASPPATASQVLEITSYAVLPSGGQKMLQYLVRPYVVFPSSTSQSFPAALTLAGNHVTYFGPGTNTFQILGQDGCHPNTQAGVPAIGFTNNGDNSQSNIQSGINPKSSNYQGAPIGSGPTFTPAIAPGSVAYVGDSSDMNSNWLDPKTLEGIVQDISSSADSLIQGPATAASFPSGMSPAHPMTIVVNGDLNLTAWHGIGYGLLLVTGTLRYDPDATWEGLVLVIGQGNFVSTSHGANGIDGAIFVAKTRDASNNVLATLGASSFSQTGSGGSGAALGRGIAYNSCLVQSAMGPITYKVISFKEIPLNN